MKNRTIWFVFFGLFSLLITLPHTPLFTSEVNIDQAVYQYIGNSILDGQIPYSDAWDHKQPLTYFIYALSSAIAGRTIWGIWFIEFVCLWITGVLSFVLLNKFCPKFISLICVLVLLFTIWSFSGISNPEQIALPFYMLSLLLFHKTSNFEISKGKENLLNVFIGITFACCFFLKQSLISVAIAISLYMLLQILLKKQWKFVRSLFFIFIGFLFISLIFIAYFSFNHSLIDYWDAAYLFNFIYANTGLLEKLSSVVDQMEIIGMIPPYIIAFGLWIWLTIMLIANQMPRIVKIFQLKFFTLLCMASSGLIVILLLLRRRLQGDLSFGVLEITCFVIALIILLAGVCKILPKSEEMIERIKDAIITLQLKEKLSEYKEIPWIALFLFPIILAFNAFPGENYQYYYTTLYPAAILLFGIFLSMILKGSEHSLPRFIMNIAVFGIGVACVYGPVFSLVLQFKKTPDNEFLATMEYIRQNTSENDFIYVWGIETSIYNAVGRKSPTRYFYQLAAVNWESYATQFSVIDEIVQALQQEKPTFFILTTEMDLGMNETECLFNSAKLGYKKPIFDLLCTNYQLDKSNENIDIYRLKAKK